MKRIVLIVGAVMLMTGGIALSEEKAKNGQEADSTAQENAAGGKQVFLTNKCQSCHSVVSQGIEKKGEDAEASKTKLKPPDLSSVGTRHTGAWMVSYLQKVESIKNVKHMKKFRGTDAELTELTTWLASLKDSTKTSTK